MRRGRDDRAAMQFLLKEFIEVPDAGTDDLEAIRRLQAQSARVFLPGPQSGGQRSPFSLQQLTLVGMKASDFQQLRRDVRNWLRSLVTHSHIAHRRTIIGPLTLSLVSASGRPDLLRGPFVEGSALDVFWFYLLHLLSRVGVGEMRVCRANRSKRAPGQRNPELLGETDFCDRLFLRRGDGKLYCSPLCQARMASQRARDPEQKATTPPTRKTNRRKKA